MLRPATPLTILFFVAFVLLLLATISTPIVKAIPLATVNGVNLGVFGYCGPSGCSKIQIGYSVGMCGLSSAKSALLDRGIWHSAWEQTPTTLNFLGEQKWENRTKSLT